jgi:hypothetical protein
MQSALHFGRAKQSLAASACGKNPQIKQVNKRFPMELKFQSPGTSVAQGGATSEALHWQPVLNNSPHRRRGLSATEGGIMKVRQLFILSCVLALSAASAAADQDKGKGHDHDHGPTIQMSWDQFKAACADPEHASPTQHQPENILVQCTDVRRTYVPENSGSVPLPAERMVTTAISSKKFYVASAVAAAAVDSGVGSCLRYKEVEESFTIEKNVGCSEILGIKGDIQDYCAANTQMVKGQNPKIVNRKDTGAMIDTCGNFSQGGGKGAGK